MTQWPSGQMKAVAFEAPGRAIVAEVEIPAARPADVLVEVDYVGVCGTDAHLLDGASDYITKGLTSYPIRFGHEWCGRITAVGDGVGPEMIGRTVVGQPIISCGQCRTCRSGHYNLCPDRAEMGVRGDVAGAAAAYLRIPAANVHPVPDAVSAPQAVLAEPAITALHAFESGAVQPGQRILVAGTGTLGLLAVQIGVAIGCRVDVVGVETHGLDSARAMGATAAYRPGQTPSDTYDVLVEASGAVGIGPLLIQSPVPGGRVVIIGIPGTPIDGIDIASLVAKEITVSGVLGGVHLLPRALSLIASGAIDANSLIDVVLPADSPLAAFERLRLQNRPRPKVLLDVSVLRQ